MTYVNFFSRDLSTIPYYNTKGGLPKRGAAFLLL